MEITSYPNRWKPGQSGNPSGLPGKPVGSRTVFSAGFTRDLPEVWAQKGKEMMIKTAQTRWSFVPIRGIHS